MGSATIVEIRFFSQDNNYLSKIAEHFNLKPSVMAIDINHKMVGVMFESGILRIEDFIGIPDFNIFNIGGVVTGQGIRARL